MSSSSSSTPPAAAAAAAAAASALKLELPPENIRRQRAAATRIWLGLLTFWSGTSVAMAWKWKKVTKALVGSILLGLFCYALYRFLTGVKLDQVAAPKPAEQRALGLALSKGNLREAQALFDLWDSLENDPKSDHLRWAYEVAQTKQLEPFALQILRKLKPTFDLTQGRTITWLQSAFGDAVKNKWAPVTQVFLQSWPDQLTSDWICIQFGIAVKGAILADLPLIRHFSEVLKPTLAGQAALVDGVKKVAQEEVAVEILEQVKLDHTEAHKISALAMHCANNNFVKLSAQLLTLSVLDNQMALGILVAACPKDGQQRNEAQKLFLEKVETSHIYGVLLAQAEQLSEDWTRTTTLDGVPKESYLAKLKAIRAAAVAPASSS